MERGPRAASARSRGPSPAADGAGRTPRTRRPRSPPSRRPDRTRARGPTVERSRTFRPPRSEGNGERPVLRARAATPRCLGGPPPGRPRRDASRRGDRLRTAIRCATIRSRCTARDGSRLPMGTGTSGDGSGPDPARSALLAPRRPPAGGRTAWGTRSTPVSDSRNLRRNGGTPRTSFTPDAAGERELVEREHERDRGLRLPRLTYITTLLETNLPTRKVAELRAARRRTSGSRG